MAKANRRPRREQFTDDHVAALPRKASRYFYPDPEQRGHFVRVAPKRSKAANVYAVTARNPYRKQVWATIGTADIMKIEQAREKAREVIGRIREGKRAFEPPPIPPKSYKAVAGDWLQLYVVKKGLRSKSEIERLLKNFVYPVWEKRDFASVRRLDVNDLLDAIAKDSDWNADHVLSVIRKIANWYATRDENYESPFVKGMRRTNSEDRERSRILGDEELRSIWRNAGASGMFGAFVQILLLTAQRRSKVAGTRWDAISGDGVWTIPAEAREKGNAGTLKLPKMALAIIKAQPRFADNPYVFAATRGKGPINGFNKRKAAFDKVCGVKNWTLHDCRRTGRSLLSRAGVRSDVSERVLGHAIDGVEGIYDRHTYSDEKADAVERLAALIEKIVNPPKRKSKSKRKAKQRKTGNVVPFRAAS